MAHAHVRAFIVVLGLFGSLASAQAEVLIRWDRDEIPSSFSLGVPTVVVPGGNGTAIRNAIAQGYRVYLEVDAPALAAFVPPASGFAGVVVKGAPAAEGLARLERRLEPLGARVLVAEERGKWPHIRTNWVTRNNDVLQVSGRSAQPWIENNAALLRIARAARPGSPPLLAYRWTPISLAEVDKGPALENYLVAIAEAGSFGGSLLLPLHEHLQTDLLLGRPQARAQWGEIRRYLEFYAWSLPGQYHPTANIAVVTAEPMFWFEVMNLLLRHNLPFELLDPSRLTASDLSAVDLLVVLGAPVRSQVAGLTAFAQGGGTVVLAAGPEDVPGPDIPKRWGDKPPLMRSEDRVTYAVGAGRVTEVLKGIADPDSFALEMRQILGRERRVVDIWNGITVLTSTAKAPDGESVVVTAVNYAHQPLPVQLRVRGVFSIVHVESPDEPAVLVPHTHRDGYTEFVLPSLRVGARVFLSGGI